MIAKSTQGILALSFISLYACTTPVTEPGANDTNPTPINHLRAKVRAVIPAVVTGIVATSEAIKTHNQKRDSLVAEVETAERIVSFTALQNELAPPVQHFSVDASRDTLITCEQGTKVFLPANVFGDSDSVHVCVEEYYSQTDFISRDLSTVSGGRILESGGTVKVTATNGDEWLEVEEGESYTVLFPKNQPDTAAMQTFYGERGEDGIMDWTEAQISGQTQEDTILEVPNYSVYISDASRPLLPVKKKWRFRDSKEERNLSQYFAEEFNHFEEQPVSYKRYEFSGHNRGDDYEGWICYDLLYDGETGKITGVEWSSADNDHEAAVDPAIREFLLNLPPLKDNVLTMGLISNFICFTIQVDFEEEVYRQQFEAKYNDYKDKVIEKMPLSELGYYILSTTEVGWINCDRFLASDSKSTDLVIESALASNTKYYLLFENFRSVICPTSFTDNGCKFPYAPIGEPVKLVAISFIHEQPVMATEQFNISSSVIRLDNFQPFSIDDLTATLNVN